MLLFWFESQAGYLCLLSIRKSILVILKKEISHFQLI